ncbi:MAG: adenylate/guanylate cyclase domain-containing protein [FCB group bacterium]|jgi:class 3 adenylate cyclase/uncharacterized protein HemY
MKTFRLFLFSLSITLTISVLYTYPGISQNKNQLQQVNKNKDTLQNIIKNLNAQSFKLLNKNPDSSRFYADSALKLSKMLNNDDGITVSMVNIGFTYISKKDSNMGNIYIQNAIKYFQTKNNRKGEAILDKRIGDNYLKINDKNYALNYYYLSLAIYIQLNDTKNISYLLTHKIGDLYINIGAFPKAFEVLFRSLKFSEENKDNYGIADACTNIGVVYINQNDINNAIRYFNKSININKILKRNLSIAECLINLGVYYANKDNINEALKNYLDAIALYNQTGAKVESTIYINIGILYQKLNNYDTALIYFKKALIQTTEEENKEEILITNIYIGNLFNETQDYIQAEEYFIQSIKIAKEINNLYWLSQAYFNIALVYEKMNNYKLAYDYHVLYSAINDSLFNQENSNKIGKIEMKYEQDKKDIIVKQEKQIMNIVMISFIIGFVLVLFLAFFIYRNYRIKKKAHDEVSKKNVIISLEREKSEKLLLNILPETIATRLKEGEPKIADNFDEASVIFIDQVGFTKNSSDTSPGRVVEILNKIYTEFDKIAEKYELEKIKTIGDCYMAASGIPIPNKDHAEAAALFAIEVMQKIDGYKTEEGTEIRFRTGIACGPVVAGIIGEKKFIYDLWGDTVNMASRMEEYGVAGKVQVTERFKNKLPKSYKFEERGEIEIKGKIRMKTWFLKTGD